MPPFHFNELEGGRKTKRLGSLPIQRRVYHRLPSHMQRDVQAAWPFDASLHASINHVVIRLPDRQQNYLGFGQVITPQRLAIHRRVGRVAVMRAECAGDAFHQGALHVQMLSCRPAPG